MTMPSSLRLKSQKDTQPQLLGNAGENEQVLPQQSSQSLPSSLRLKAPVQPKQEEHFMTDEEFERANELAQAKIWSRIGETALGAPGDIAEFFSSIPGLTGLSGIYGKNILPTSHDIREFGKKATGGALEPKTPLEEKIGEFASDVTSVSLPGSGPFKAIRNLGIPIVGALAKEGLKYANADEKTQAYGKVGTMVALDLLSRRTGGARKHASELFQKAEESLPKGVSFDASNLEQSLVTLERDLTKGGQRTTTSKALDKILEIKKEIKNGKIDAKRLAAYRPAINEAIDDLGGFNIEISKKNKPAAIRNLNRVKNEVIKSLDEYGAKYNPEYQKYNRDANEAYAAYQKSNKIANFIQNKISYSPKSKALQALFSFAPTASLGALSYFTPGVGAAAGAGVLGYQGYKILDRVIRSPSLRKYYFNVLKGASAGNVPLVEKNIKALDKEVSDTND